MAGNNRVLVLGATGGIGGEVARRLRDAGWGVRALKRGAAHDSEQRDGILWLRGDAMNPRDVLAAAKGCSVIVHAVNPPGYRRWAELVLPMLDNTVAAAIAEGATIVLPGTVYNYGPDAFPLLAEASPQHPATRKGAIRVEMERRLQSAAERGASVLIVRAGDFFGPQAGNSWFSQGLVKPRRPIRTIGVPGNKGVGHEWSYLPDVARTMVELLARQDTLDRFATFHMAGHWDADGVQMAQSIQRVVHKRTGIMPRIGAFPWALLTLASPFVPTFRELREMRYLWRQPIRMDNTRLVQVLGHEPHTPLDDAVDATLEGLGCFASAVSAPPSLTAVPLNSAKSALAVSVAASLLACATPEHAPAPLRIDTSAPVVSRHDILIDAPLERVWRIQTDISRWPAWRPTVPAARNDGELAVGSAFHWEEGGLKIVSTVHELLPMRRIVWTGPAQGICAVHAWEFTQTPEGTRVHTEESWNGEPVRAQASTLQPLLDHALQDWLARLKRVSEGPEQR